jgi:hypothetical protein
LRGTNADSNTNSNSNGDTDVPNTDANGDPHTYAQSDTAATWDSAPPANTAVMGK